MENVLEPIQKKFVDKDWIIKIKFRDSTIMKIWNLLWRIQVNHLPSTLKSKINKNTIDYRRIKFKKLFTWETSDWKNIEYSLSTSWDNNFWYTTKTYVDNNWIKIKEFMINMKKMLKNNSYPYNSTIMDAYKDWDDIYMTDDW